MRLLFVVTAPHRLYAGTLNVPYSVSIEKNANGKEYDSSLLED